MLKGQKITILNPAPAVDEIPKELLQYTDIITPNETESAKITGIAIKDNSTLATNAEKLHMLGVKTWLLPMVIRVRIFQLPMLKN